MLPVTRDVASERNGGGNGSLSRPFVLGVVLVILFLTIQADWNAANSRRQSGRRGAPLYSNGNAGDGSGGVGGEMSVGSAVGVQSAYNKDILILDLQRSMQKLEDENAQLRIEVLSLKTRAAFCGDTTGATPADDSGTATGLVVDSTDVNVKNKPIKEEGEKGTGSGAATTNSTVATGSSDARGAATITKSGEDGNSPR